MATILCLDDEPAIGLILQDTLERAGHHAVAAHNVPQALQALSGGAVDLIISDYRMPGLTGLEFLALLRQEGHDTPLIMLTGYGSIEHAVSAIKAGAIDYITKPVRPEQLELAVNQALEVVRLRRENERLRREVIEFRNERQIIGNSRGDPARAPDGGDRRPDASDRAARGRIGHGQGALRAHDPRAKRPSRRAVHPAQLRRASRRTGRERALRPRKGRVHRRDRRVEGAFERAHGGTLLLDEISEMRLDLQAKLLRVLQEQEFERVGGSTAIKVDVRIVATTNRDLAAFAASGNFRQDLYYRLGVIPVRLPPLRERKEDIPLLSYRFAAHYGQEIGKEITGISPEAADLLQQYDWPGNVRELQHAVERAVILTTESMISLHAFDGQRFGLSGAWSGPTPARIFNGLVHSNGNGETHAAPAVPDGAVVITSLNVNDAEAKLIERALEVANGNRTRAADLLGISVRTLRNKLNGTKADSDGG